MSAHTSNPVHFLLVDDLEENLLALEGLLRREGLVLLKATSGAAALEMLLAHDVALALVDVRMPDMDGFELAELMRGSERTRRVPIIFLTAGNDERPRFRGYEAGAVDFLQKPIQPDILRSKADVFFELYRQRDELRAASEENARLLAESRGYTEILKDSDRRKDEFLATLAHELRNPLAPIRNALEIVKLAGGGQGPAGQAIAVMERQLAQMVHLIDDLLDVSRITRGKLHLRKERVELGAVLESAIESAKPLLDQERHQLTVEPAPGPLPIDGDPTRLAQIFSNLLTNAAKYTPPGGKIRIAVRKTPTPECGDEVAVAVGDDGIGIPREMLERVFEMFSQVDRAIEKTSGGLGIGLALVRGLVEMHHGRIHAESEGEGRGSEFIVHLPLAVQPATRTLETKHQHLAESSQAARVLVVDDNADSAQSLAMMLALTGNEVRTAFDGLQAIDAAREFRPAVVLMDIGMPRLNGYDAARRIRQEPWGQTMALVALTGWGQDEDRKKSADAGFDRHLVKPVNPETLAKLLAELTGT